MVDGKTVFITGAGSLAKAITQELLLNHRPKKIILFSRDEFLQHVAKEELNNDKIRYIIGDVRDENSLKRATQGVDYLIHTAALKRIDTIEYNPLEAVRTNIEGTENVVRACTASGIEKATFVSTDKAVLPINFYGMTKGLGEKIWVYSNMYRTIFNCVRYGNVMGSRGSVLPLFKRCANNRLPFPITDKKMTRFWIDMKQAVRLILMAIESKEGATYVLKSPTFKVTDLAKALSEEAKFDVIGLRPGEKLHEVLIGAHEIGRVVDNKWYYTIAPEIKYNEEVWPEGKGEELVSKKGNVGVEEIKKWLS